MGTRWSIPTEKRAVIDRAHSRAEALRAIIFNSRIESERLRSKRLKAKPLFAVFCFLWLISAAAQRPNRPPAPNTFAASIPVQSDEFVGPFSSWANVKTGFGAAADGTVDDTSSIQHALDELGKPGHSPVLFFPSGVYRIRMTLMLASSINISIVGEDPATTKIVWDGEPGGTMLWLNGVAYSRFVRFTLDGKHVASVAVEQSWDGTHPYFDTGNEYSDNAFVDVEYGIQGGFKGGGFAETAIRRSRFLRNTKAGVALGNFNALDIWIWDSLFEDCYTGVTNSPGAGNFRVYNSVFRRSTRADLAIGNTGGFSARGNYSTGSKAFFIGGGTNNPATINIQRNTIIDPVDGSAINFGNQGPGLITDNVIRSRPSAAGPVIVWRSFIDADVTSVGNIFTIPNPLNSNGRLTSIDDQVVSRTTVNPVEPDLPGPLPNMHRQIVEVPSGAQASEIQNAISAAVRQTGTRPIVHIPWGTYSIAETLIVPISDIQLAGDGYGTILRWTGAGAGPLLRVMGPSKATLREIQFDGAGKTDSIVIDNVDQAGSRVYMGQAELRAGKRTNLFVNGLDHTNVQVEDFGYAYSPDAASIKVTGGRLSSRGNPTAGKTNIFSGASSGNRISYDVSGGGRVLVRDLWYEGGAGPGFANIYGRALFTIEGARIASPTNGTVVAAFNIMNLDGRAAILTTQLDDRIEVSGDGARAKVLGLGVMAERKSSNYFLNYSSPAAEAVLLNSRQLSILPGIRSAPTTNTGLADAAFLRTMLSHTRGEMPTVLKALPSGVTDVRLFRVWAANGLNNITLNSGASR